MEAKRAVTPINKDPQKQALSTVRSLLEQSKAQIKMALPKHMTAERMMRVAITAVQKQPKLLECDPISLVGAVIQSAQLGLEPDGVTNMAHLVPFNNARKNRMEVQFMPGYRGLVALARRSDQVSIVDARPVHEKDRFEFEFGTDAKIVHVPSREADRGVVIYFYALAKLKDGSVQFEVMTAEDVNIIRDASQGYKAAMKYAKEGQTPNTPWVTHYEEMGKKTVLRRLCKLLPVSIELATAVALDERAEQGLPQDLGTIIDTSAVGTDMSEGNGGKGPVQMPQTKDEAAGKITKQQAAELSMACEKAGKTDEQVGDYLMDMIGSPKIDDIPADFFQQAMTWANSK